MLCKGHAAATTVSLSNKMFVLLERFAAEPDKRSIKCKNLHWEDFCLKRRQGCLGRVRRGRVLVAPFVLSLRSVPPSGPQNPVPTHAKVKCHTLLELSLTEKY